VFYNNIEKLIQVSKSLENDKTKKRELEVFKKTIDELNLIDVKSIIISEDKSSKFLYNEQEIEVKNILEWLNFD
jgi:ribosome biogenesis protein Nip4